jgi:hypothetical protein
MTSIASIERTRYFARQLVGPDDLTQDQLYFREKLRRHNRMLHGWGIVCGARVKRLPRDKSGCKVIVEPGYILGPYGDEIVIDEALTVDLCSEALVGDSADPCAGSDPWCSDVRAERPADEFFYLAVRYEDCPTRPVRVYGCGCGCDEAECEYSRVRDDYVIRVLNELPESYADLLNTPNRRLGQACVGGPPECIECPSDPWVILCGFKLGDRRVSQLECADFRRYAVTFAPQYYVCPKGAVNGSGGMLSSDIHMYVDSNALAGDEPQALALMRTAEGSWASLPLHFQPEAGDTYATLAARDGARELVDAETGDTVTVADLLALAGVNPDAEVGSSGELRDALEGVALRTTDLEEVRTELDELYDAEGREKRRRENLDVPAAALELPAVTLKGVDRGSDLGKRVESLSVAEVAGTERDKFIRNAVKGSRGADREDLERRAGALWESARKAANAVERLTGER